MNCWLIERYRGQARPHICFVGGDKNFVHTYVTIGAIYVCNSYCTAPKRNTHPRVLLASPIERLPT
jgi:hypothetical protein